MTRLIPTLILPSSLNLCMNSPGQQTLHFIKRLLDVGSIGHGSIRSGPTEYRRLTEAGSYDVKERGINRACLI